MNYPATQIASLLIRVRISDGNGNQIISHIAHGGRTEEQISELHRQIAKANPESFVNFVWIVGGRPSFICGMRHGEKVDQELLENGLITNEEYDTKWNPWMFKNAA